MPRKTMRCPNCNGSGKIIGDYYLDAISVLAHLDELMQKKYSRSQANHDLVIQRLKQGATKELCIQVIDQKFKDWEWSDMIKYMRPLTLFGKQKFSQYVGEVE